MSAVTLGGNPVVVVGEFPKTGDVAIDFKLTNRDLADLSLADFAGKRKILNIVPSLDTDVCAQSARKFNAEAGSLDNTVVLVISADLPFAQKRFCSTEGLDNVVTLSTLRSGDFMQNYGVKIAAGVLAGVTARAVVVLDEHDKVMHAQLVPEITNEPDYEAALAVLK